MTDKNEVEGDDQPVFLKLTWLVFANEVGT